MSRGGSGENTAGEGPGLGMLGSELGAEKGLWRGRAVSLAKKGREGT